MADECPHRRAPLSRGRLFHPSTPSPSGKPPSAVLECAYHGWQFNGGGQCVRVPQMLPQGYQAPDIGGNGGSCAGSAPAGGSGSSSASQEVPSGSSGGAAGGPRQPPRACSGRAYPTAVAQGMVWVWFGGAGSPPDESTIPLDFAEVGAQQRGESWALVDVFTRDFPYDWETMVENVVDPAHVAFAHDGTGQGLDRHAAPPLELQVLESGATGFTGRFRGVRTLPGTASSASSSAASSASSASASSASASSSSPVSSSASSSDPSASASSPSFAPGAWSVVEFRPPCLVSMRFTLPGRGEAGLVLYCVPLGRGRSRMLARLPRNFATGWLAGLQPRWAKHLPRMGVLDQDIDLLREQEQIMAQDRLQRLLEADQQQQRQQQKEQRQKEEKRQNEQENPEPPQRGDGSSAGGSGDSSSGGGGGGSRLGGDWRRGYVMPAPADRFVVAFRRWLDEAGPSQPWAQPEATHLLVAAAAGARDPLSREQVLDRYQSHVKSCSACSGALANFQRLKAACATAALAALAVAAGLAAATTVAAAGAVCRPAAAAATAEMAATAAAATVSVAAPGPAVAAAVAAAVLAAVLAGVAAWAGRMAQRFIYTEEGRELRMNEEDRWLRRLLFSGTNSFNSMVALTSANTTANSKKGSASR